MAIVSASGEAASCRTLLRLILRFSSSLETRALAIVAVATGGSSVRLALRASGDSALTPGAEDEGGGRRGGSPACLLLCLFLLSRPFHLLAPPLTEAKCARFDSWFVSGPKRGSAAFGMRLHRLSSPVFNSAGSQPQPVPPDGSTFAGNRIPTRSIHRQPRSQSDRAPTAKQTPAADHGRSRLEQRRAAAQRVGGGRARAERWVVSLTQRSG